MPASFDEPPPDKPRPQQPQQEVRDENLGTIFKIGGSSCIATCTCGLGIILLIPVLLFAPYGVNIFSGAFGLIGLLCIAVGCYAAYYGWRTAEEGSKW